MAEKCSSWYVSVVSVVIAILRTLLAGNRQREARGRRALYGHSDEPSRNYFMLCHTRRTKYVQLHLHFYLVLHGS